MQLQTSNTRQQFEETKNLQQTLLVEQHQLKLQIAAFEKDKIAKEGYYPPSTFVCFMFVSICYLYHYRELKLVLLLR